MKKYVASIITVLLLFIVFLLPIKAAELPGIDEYITEDIYYYLPDSIKGALTDKESYTGPGVDEVIGFILNVLEQAISPTLNILFNIIGVVLLCACFNMLAGLGELNAASRMYRFLASLCLALMIYSLLDSLWVQTSDLLIKLNSMMNSITIATTSVYALSGAVTTAVVNQSQMMIVLTVIEDIAHYGTYPLLQVCYGMSFIGCISESVDLSSLVSLIRKTFTTLLIILMSIMSAVLSFQSTLTESNDSLLIRSAKLASGSFIPIIGGAVSEATSTVAAGLSSLKSTLGIISIIALAVSVLPLLVSLWFNKLSFFLGSALCEVLSLERESVYLKGSGELIDFAIAIISAVALVFIINLMIFAKSATVLAV